MKRDEILFIFTFCGEPDSRLGAVNADLVVVADIVRVAILVLGTTILTTRLATVIKK